MRYTFTDLLEDARRLLGSRVIRIGLMLICYALLAKFGLPIDQANPMAEAIHASVDYVLLAGIAAMIRYRQKAQHRIEVGPKAAASRAQARQVLGSEPVTALDTRPL